MGIEERLQELLAEQAEDSTVSMRELNQKTRAVIDRVAKEGMVLTVTDKAGATLLHPFGNGLG